MIRDLIARLLLFLGFGCPKKREEILLRSRSVCVPENEISDVLRTLLLDMFISLSSRVAEGEAGLPLMIRIEPKADKWDWWLVLRAWRER